MIDEFDDLMSVETVMFYLCFRCALRARRATCASFLRTQILMMCTLSSFRHWLIRYLIVTYSFDQFENSFR